MQLIEAAQQPILRIDARTKFALLFGVGISSLMFPPLWLEATTFVLMNKNLRKIYCCIPHYASVGLDTVVKSQRRLCSTVFFSCKTGKTYAPDFYGRNTADENYFCKRVYAFF